MTTEQKARLSQNLDRAKRATEHMPPNRAALTRNGDIVAVIEL